MSHWQIYRSSQLYSSEILFPYAQEYGGRLAWLNVES